MMALRSGIRGGVTLDEAYIGDMENGFAVASLTTVLRIAVALDCKVTALVSAFDTVDLSAILQGELPTNSFGTR
jgi:hypothetical protein